MIVPLIVTAGIVAIALWLTAMYVLWQQETGNVSKSAANVITKYVEVYIRLIRRGWYACALYMRSVGHWSNGKAQKVFFALFPAAEPAFAKRDRLAGLKHGPTSYFLRTISEKESVSKKTTRKAFS